MVIRVDSKTIEGRQGLLTAGAEGRRTAEAPAAPPPVRRPTDSTAQLSGVSARMKAIEQTLAGEPFDAQRVEKIKAEIREGRYKMNPEKVADAILESAVLLGKNAQNENH